MARLALAFAGGLALIGLAAWYVVDKEVDLVVCVLSLFTSCPVAK